jgi:formylglycine-generating enzyme required for sulfatase activity
MTPHRHARRHPNPAASAALLAGLVLLFASPRAADPLPEDDDAPRIFADTSRAPTAADLGDFEVPRETPLPRTATASPGAPERSRPATRPGRAKVRRSRPAKNPPVVLTVESGCFQMGSRDGEGSTNERPRHRVCLDSFRLDRDPVTQGEFRDSTGSAPWSTCAGPACAHPDDLAPAWYLTWSEADGFCRKKGGTLPTEAQYEYVLRAGDSTVYPWGPVPDSGCAYANLADLSLARALPGWKVFPCDDREPFVGRGATRRPNRWGFRDLSGNVWEWTSDWYAADAYSRTSERNPTGPDSGTGKVIRGGSWMTGPDGARSAYRDGFNPEGRYTGSIGFRCAYPAR